MVVTERGLGRSVVACCAGFGLAVLFAVGAALTYERPNVLGLPGRSLWLERDVLCSLASSALALAVAWGAGRRITRTRIFNRLLLHSLVWFGLTVGLFLFWSGYIFLFTLLVAPTHALAALRLVLLWQAWRVDVAWRAG